MSTRGLPTLQVLSVNVNGLCGQDKRRTLFHALQTSSWDVVALQETHHADDAEALRWQQEGAGPTTPWLGSTFWAHGARGQRGVALLFREGAIHDLQPQLLHTDPGGRFVCVKVTFQGQTIDVSSVYAPCTPCDRIPFFLSILPHLDPAHIHIMGGDFNCIGDLRDQSVTLDTHDAASVPAAQGRLQGYAGGLQVIEDHLSMVDAWRHLHPDDVCFTHTGTARLSHARLDRWLVSLPLQGSVTAAGMIHGLPGDHVGVSIVLVFRSGTVLGPGIWRLPPWVLADPAFRTLAEARIPTFWAEHVHGADLSHGQRWEDFKTWFRDLAQGFILGQHRKTRMAASFLTSAAEVAHERFCANPHDPRTCDAWLTARAALTTFREEQARAAAVKSGLLYDHLGEQPTGWFHRLHRQRQTQTHLSSLVAPGQQNAIPLSSPGGREAAAATLVSFFSGATSGGMYASRPTDVAAQDELLGAIDARLSEQRMLACDAPLTQEELLAALRGTARNKAPGSDGLPYEFYSSFWALVSGPLLAAFVEAIEGGIERILPPTICMGTITLLYKGKGLPRDQPGSYRPITLLNTDYKIVARALACRWGPAAAEVVDQTQTAFIPGRWIGDNVLTHLEEIDYCQHTQTPGVILFLDSAKAYDRLDVGWLHRCMEAVGFGPHARRWVSLLHTNRQARVRFNGWLTPAFPVISGVAQGSPLSPLLYALAAQPLAAYLRAMAFQGLVHGIPLPGGGQAPLTHQHADDLTVHVRNRDAAHFVMQGPVQLFCRASAAKIQPLKAQGLEFGVADPFHGVCPLTGIPFAADSHPIRHLGILLGRDPLLCRGRMYAGILQRMERLVTQWACTSMSLFGRSYVARQCLLSVFTYHAAFVMPPADFLGRVSVLLATFVACGDRADPTRRPAALFPNRLVSSLAWDQGGIRCPDPGVSVTALQASIPIRFLQPAPHAWKSFFAFWLGQSEGPHVLGPRFLFTSHVLAPQAAPLRVRNAITAFRSLCPHRAEGPLSPSAVLLEPLFGNSAVLGTDGQPLRGTRWRSFVDRGVAIVGDMRGILHRMPVDVAAPLQPAEVDALLASMPLSWQGVVLSAAPPYPDWSTCPAHPGVVLRHLLPPSPHTPAVLQVFGIHHMPIGQCPQLFPDGDYHLLDSLPSHTLLPVVVGPWAPPHQAGIEPTRLCLLSAAHMSSFDPQPWECGPHPLLSLTVAASAQRLRDLQLWRKNPGHHAHAPLRPPIWEDDWGAQAPVQPGLRAAEERQRQRSLQVGGSGPLPPPAEVDCGVPSWLDLSRPLPIRISVRDRVAATLAEAQPFLPACPPPEQNHRRSRHLPAPDSLTDVLASPLPAPPPPPWRHVWRAVHKSGLDRGDRVTALRVLHGCLFTGVFKASVHRCGPEDRFCLYPACGRGTDETLSHLYVSCPQATLVWGWLGDVWEALTFNRFPIHAGLLLADDHRVWSPPPELRALWMRLRIITIGALWRACCRRRHGETTTPLLIAAGIVAKARAAMARDAFLVRAPRPLMDTVRGDTVPARIPGLSREEFRARWCHRGILCRWAEGDVDVEVRFTSVHPAGVPQGVG